MAGDLLLVYPGAVAAAQVHDDVSAIHGAKLAVHARDSIEFYIDVVLRTAPNPDLPPSQDDRFAIIFDKPRHIAATQFQESTGNIISLSLSYRKRGRNDGW